MLNVEKHVSYWTSSATEDMEVARELIEKDRYRHGLFFGHLAMEKILKAHVCQKTQELAPKTHDLLRLSHLACLEITENQKLFFAEFGRYQMEWRYPELLEPPPIKDEAKSEMKKAEEIFLWLIKKLSA